jgi:hypothetical protein
VWCNRQADPLLMLTHAWRHSKKNKLKWYVAVNARCRLLGVLFTLGTTDLPLRITVRLRAQTAAGGPLLYNAWNTYRSNRQGGGE